MLKDSDRELLKVPAILAFELGKFLVQSMREPIEYALDQTSTCISRRELRKGILKAAAVPIVSLSTGLAVGLLNENVTQGTCATLSVWLAAGIIQRVAWIQDYGQS